MKRRDEVLVGVFVTLVSILLVVGIIWLTRGGLTRGYPLYAQFSWGQNLKKGHPVLLAGQSIGYVSDVELGPGYLDVELRVEDEVKIPKGAEATVVPVGIFGDVAIAFTPKLPLNTVYYTAGDTVPVGPAPADLGKILRTVDSILPSINRLTTAIERDLVEAGGLRDLRRMIGSMAQTATQMQSVMANQDRNLTLTFAEFRATANRLAGAIDSAMIDSTVRNVRGATANMTRLLAQVDSTNRQFQGILTQVNSGNGSLGMLIRDTTLYSNSRNLLARMDSLLADFTKNPKKYINVQFSVF